MMPPINSGTIHLSSIKSKKPYGFNFIQHHKSCLQPTAHAYDLFSWLGSYLFHERCCYKWSETTRDDTRHERRNCNFKAFPKTEHACLRWQRLLFTLLQRTACLFTPLMLSVTTLSILQSCNVLNA